MHVIGLCPSKFVEETLIVTVVKERKKNSKETRAQSIILG